jgi:hypothetical protein
LNFKAGFIVVFRIFTLVFFSILVSACATSFHTPHATGHYASSPVQCVPHARAVSGVQIYGDAHTWWDQANPPRYGRSAWPRAGSVMVLARTARMRHGHVAVVKQVLNNREITVSHSNWGSDRKNRRIIYDSVRVRDVSVANDWSSVSFWNHGGQNFGFPYAVRGFIYRQ